MEKRNVNNKLNKITFFLLLMIAIISGVAQQTPAATWMVTKVADTNDGVCDKDCSLREAVAVALDNDDITFQPLLAGNTITLNPQFLSISIAKSITINGIDKLSISGGDQTRVFSIVNHANVTMNNLDIGHGYMDSTPAPYIGAGGAIFMLYASLELNDCYIHNNAAAYTGGAIAALYSTLNIKNGLLAANKANSAGGGIYSIYSRIGISNTRFNLNNTRGSGGAMFVKDSNLNITDSSIYKSSAEKGGALYLAVNQEGVYTIRDSSIHNNAAQNGGGIYNFGKLNFINSTLSNNNASAGDGGGLSNSGTATIRNATITLNAASGQAGGIDSLAGDVTLGNTIVAGNTNTNNFSPNLKGSFTSEGYNLIGPGISAVIWGDQTGNQLNVADPLLMPLNYNGSATLNHLPQPGSPVINAGSDALAIDEFGNPLLTDQRGLNRISGKSVEIGAVEVQE
jgi:CSLREA domain-containing protein